MYLYLGARNKMSFRGYVSVSPETETFRETFRFRRVVVFWLGQFCFCLCSVFMPSFALVFLLWFATVAVGNFMAG